MKKADVEKLKLRMGTYLKHYKASCDEYGTEAEKSDNERRKAGASAMYKFFVETIKELETK